MGLVVLKQCSSVRSSNFNLPSMFSISLEVMTLNPTCKRVETIEGVPLTVTGMVASLSP